MSQRTAMNRPRPGRSARLPVTPLASDGHANTGQLMAPQRLGITRWLRYRFDLTLSRGSGALILWLAILTSIFVLLTGALLYMVARNAPGVEDAGMVESAWDALMRTLDPGTVTGDEEWHYRVAALLITIAGIFIFSALIGLIASVIDRRIEELRKGRGLVVERGHTLILGWSEKAHTVISELMIANDNQHGGAIVVLAPRDRVDLEDEINARFGGSLALELFTGRAALGVLRSIVTRRRSGTRVVCRTGDPANPADLAIASPSRARSVIVLADESLHSPDAQTTKVLLSLMAVGTDFDSVNTVVEVVDPEHSGALEDAAGGAVRTVVSSDLIARVTAQVCRQSGMGAVFQELLDFDGDEIYFHDAPSLAGHSYGQALLTYEACSPIGLRRADGTIVLNPAMNARITEGDRIIAIAEDDDTLVLGAVDPWEPEGTSTARSGGREPDHLLVMGWNDTAPRILRHLARAAAPGSSVDLVVDTNLVTVDEEAAVSAVARGVAEAEAEGSANGSSGSASGRMRLRLIDSESTRKDGLEQLLAGRAYERLVLLGYRDSLPAPEADARTLLTLVHARRILGEGHVNEQMSIVAEVLEQRSVELGRVANPDDFVVSERLTSLLIAQLAENGELATVFAELLDGMGAEIVMEPLSRYLATDTDAMSVPYRSVARAARELGESPIGYMVPTGVVGGGVRINPPKSASVPVVPSTRVVVLA